MRRRVINYGNGAFPRLVIVGRSVYSSSNVLLNNFLSYSRVVCPSGKIALEIPIGNMTLYTYIYNTKKKGGKQKRLQFTVVTDKADIHSYTDKCVFRVYTVVETS